MDLPGVLSGVNTLPPKLTAQDSIAIVKIEKSFLKLF